MNNAINWILQSNLTKSEILDRIKSSIEQDDEQWEELEIVPFSDQLPKLSNNNAINIIYGSTTFMINAYNDNDWVLFKNDRLNLGSYLQLLRTYFPFKSILYHAFQCYSLEQYFSI